MKDDVEIPARVPTKRRVLEDPGQTLDKWLAIWAADESQPPGARKRAQDERDRRKRVNPEPVHLGVLVGQEGMTPEQLAYCREFAAGAEEVRAPGRVRLNFKGAFIVEPRLQEIVKASTVVVATPKEPEKPNRVEGVWEAVRYAKHRKVPVHVVLPNGDEG